MKSTQYLLIVSSFVLIFHISKLNSQETTTTPPPPENKQCTKPGLMCKNCLDLVNCVQTEGGFEEYSVETCTGIDNQYCLVNECTSKFNPNCPANLHPFKCPTNTIAFLPDPFNCKKYHVCINGAKQTFTCDRGYGYDPLSTYCKVKLTNDGCPDQLPVPPCNKSGETGPLLTNKSIYYICEKLGAVWNPNLNVCKHGGIYENSVCK